MNSRRIIWMTITFFVIVLFFYLIPVHVYDKHSFIYSLLGAVLFGACLFQTLGNFESIYDIIHEDTTQEKDSLAKMAPFAAIPAIILIFVLFFHHSGRKDYELEANGVLTKGMVTGGHSTTTTRRMQKSTSYEVDVTYADSANRQYTFEASVSGSEFNNRYQGEQVDVIYSKLHPSLARLVLNVNELAKYKKIPQEKLTVNHLVALLEGKVKQDSILDYLNSINYEWIRPEGDMVYVNEKLDIAVNINPEARQVVFVQRDRSFGTSENDFEASLGDSGFKKKASNVEGETREIFYNEKYIVSKERKTDSNTSSSGMPSLQIIQIYYIGRLGDGEVAAD